MEKLPENFEYHKYGVDVRLATEEDSEFILSLRTNGALNAFLHETSDDLEKQRQWMREYKERESEGVEYYFIYSSDGEPFGVDRISRIDPETRSYTGGSWICKPGVKSEQIFGEVLANIDIQNHILGLGDNYYDVRKGNKKVLRFHRQVMRAKEIGETELDVLFYTNSQMRENTFERVLKFL